MDGCFCRLLSLQFFPYGNSCGYLRDKLQCKNTVRIGFKFSGHFSWIVPSIVLLGGELYLGIGPQTLKQFSKIVNPRNAFVSLQFVNCLKLWDPDAVSKGTGHALPDFNPLLLEKYGVALRYVFWNIYSMTRSSDLQNLKKIVFEISGIKFFPFTKH